MFYLDFIESRYSPTELKTITKEKWIKPDKTEVVASHPPAETIVFKHGSRSVVASPFKLTDPNDEPNKRLIEQNNYTNQSLITIGKQLDKIETKIDKSLPVESKLKSAEKPLVQFQDLQPKFALKTSSTIDKIEEMLKQLKTEQPEKSGVKVIGSYVPLDTQSETESESNTESVESSNISKIENAFKNLELESELKVKKLTNPTSLTRNWYPKPTPPDIQNSEPYTV
ncbi:unnamed protein product [Prunus armeniaca]